LESHVPVRTLFVFFHFVLCVLLDSQAVFR
jgi:hypothetical protein